MVNDDRSEKFLPLDAIETLLKYIGVKLTKRKRKGGTIVAGISKVGNGWRLQFIDGNKVRQFVWLGKLNADQARQAKTFIQRLIVAHKSQTLIDDETARWMGKIGLDLANRLADLDLMPRRQAAGATTLGPFLTDFFSKLACKPATRIVLGHTRRDLLK